MVLAAGIYEVSLCRISERIGVPVPVPVRGIARKRAETRHAMPRNFWTTNIWIDLRRCPQRAHSPRDRRKRAKTHLPWLSRFLLELLRGQSGWWKLLLNSTIYDIYMIWYDTLYIYVGDANADDHPPGSTDQMAQISKDWDPNLVKKATKSVNLTLYLVL